MCYDCRRIPYPRDCDRVRKCGDHEVRKTSDFFVKNRHFSLVYFLSANSVLELLN